MRNETVEYLTLTRGYALEQGTTIVALGADNVWENWCIDNLLEERPDKWSLSMMAVASDRPIGYGIASRRDDTVHLHHLVVGAEWRSRGVGAELLRHMAMKALGTGAKAMTLKVYKENIRALEFYKRLRFTVAGDESDQLLWMVGAVDEVCGSDRTRWRKSRVAIHQPNYSPWCGYFAKMRVSDVFVFLDDVQMPGGQSYVYRCRIRSGDGNGTQWLSIPTTHTLDASIREVTFAHRNWARKHTSTLRSVYGRCPYFKEVFSLIEPIYAEPGDNLAAFNIRLIQNLAAYLGLSCRFETSTNLRPAGTGDDRLISLARRLGAQTYISGKGGQSYQNPIKFQQSEITLEVREYEPIQYHQGRGPFLPRLSILDALFSVGQGAKDLLRYDVPSQLLTVSGTSEEKS